MKTYYQLQIDDLAGGVTIFTSDSQGYVNIDWNVYHTHEDEFNAKVPEYSMGELAEAYFDVADEDGEPETDLDKVRGLISKYLPDWEEVIF